MSAATAEKTTAVAACERKHSARKPLPKHLPRERVIVPAAGACPASGGTRLSNLGEDVTETFEISRTWRIVQIVREKISAGIARG